MIADQVDGPGADDDEYCGRGDDGSADHNVAPFTVSRAYPPVWMGGRGHELNSDPTVTFQNGGVFLMVMLLERSSNLGPWNAG